MSCYNFLVVLLILTGSARSNSELALLGPPCCPQSPSAVLRGGECADGTNITLDCDGQGMYRFTPDEDFFRIQDSVLKIPSDDGSIDEIQPDKFCTALDIVNSKEVEIAILCFNNTDPIDIYHSKFLYELYAYCLLISDIFLVITLVIYCIFPNLRDLQGKCIICFTISLFIAYFSLAMMQLEFLGITVTKELCVFSGFFTYYWLLCVFFWLYNVCFNIWKGASTTNTWPEKTLWIGYLLFGFGGPLLLLTVALITHHIPGDHIKPNFDNMVCWFPGKVETWAFFYGPVSVLLFCNIIYFILTAVRLWKDYRQPSPQPRIRTLRFKWFLCLKLFLSMGITWIFEVLSFLHGTHWLITDILNCLQGFIIFIVMVATRKKVIRTIITSSLFSSYITTNWQIMDDEESIEEVNNEQIQLS